MQKPRRCAVTGALAASSRSTVLSHAAGSRAYIRQHICKKLPAAARERTLGLALCVLPNARAVFSSRDVLVALCAAAASLVGLEPLIVNLKKKVIQCVPNCSGCCSLSSSCRLMFLSTSQSVHEWQCTLLTGADTAGGH